MKTISFLALLSLLATAYTLNLKPFGTTDPTEIDFQALYKTYMRRAPFFVTETQERYSTFKSQILDIIHHNRDPSKTYSREDNRFTALTLEELNGFALMSPQTCNLPSGFETPYSTILSLPESFDWRDKNMVTPVKSQSTCGASWAFAAASAIESHWAISSGTTPDLMSDQQLIDCSNDFENQGCTGGLPSQAYEYVRYNGGVNTENTYPFVDQNQSCGYNNSVIGAQVPYGSVNITAGDEATIMEALVQYGPISVVFDATDDFLSYKDGVYVGTTCGSTPQVVNHAALIVGYGTESSTGVDYWICKNSWGSGWGENGYFRIQRGVNMCGIAECASYPSMTATAITA